MNREVISFSVEDTESAGRQLAATLQSGDLVGLEGELGAGKTCFVRGLVEGLGGEAAEVRSPTFVLHQVHSGGRLAVHHIDLYRLEQGAEVEFLDLPGLLEGGVVVIEWASRADLSELQTHTVRIDVDEAERRVIEMSGR